MQVQEAVRLTLKELRVCYMPVCCAEVKMIVRHIFWTTRAERGALITHNMGCLTCRTYCQEFTSGLSFSETRDLDNLLRVDMLDPEFVKHRKCSNPNCPCHKEFS